MTLLLVILALLGGFHLGILCTIHTIKTRYPLTWAIMAEEMQYVKKERAKAARKEDK